MHTLRRRRLARYLAVVAALVASDRLLYGRQPQQPAALLAQRERMPAAEGAVVEVGVEVGKCGHWGRPIFTA